MPEPFKLIDSQFIDGEGRGTYRMKTNFREQLIIASTITEHYQVKHKDVITNELILKILEKKLNGKWIEPLPNSYSLGGRDIFLFETTYNNENYRLFFGFKDHTTNHLGIRNCHPQD